MPEEKTKVCGNCKQEKSLLEFARKKSSKGGYSSKCKKCHNIYYKEYYSKRKNMIEHIARIQKNKQKNLDRFAKYKVKVGCQICGYNKCSKALEFHHLDKEEKRDDVAVIFALNSKKRLSEEIQKCVLVCANCHREIESGLVVIPDDIQPLDILEDERFLA